MSQLSPSKSTATAVITDQNLNDKFNCLIKKIEKQKDNENENKDGNGGSGELEKYNKDKALKELYDESVDFKNTLA